MKEVEAIRLEVEGEDEINLLELLQVVVRNLPLIAKITTAAVILSAKEQPAAGAGRSTSLSGLRMAAVSAMKRTPQNTMVLALDSAQSLASW